MLTTRIQERLPAQQTIGTSNITYEPILGQSLVQTYHMEGYSAISYETCEEEAFLVAYQNTINNSFWDSEVGLRMNYGLKLNLGVNSTGIALAWDDANYGMFISPKDFSINFGWDKTVEGATVGGGIGINAGIPLAVILALISGGAFNPSTITQS